ncbi:RmlC-like cupin domain-containing protein [Phycomyces nitens]|nr:RmlC-like cupin domain-containing protein [Phycomyces nitens]
MPPNEFSSPSDAFDTVDSQMHSDQIKVNSSSNESTLTGLVNDIHKVLGPDQGLDSKDIDAGEIIRLMEQYSSNSKDWAKYAMFDHSRAYTRNLIDDGNGKFNLMILAWSKDQQSPIHNHSGSHCIMKILDGELQETLYDWPCRVEESGESADITAAVAETEPTIGGGTPLNVSRDTVYHANQVTYVHDSIGLHRIRNPSQQQGAVSLHLYTPPYQLCKTFEEKTGKARSSGVCTFYSVKGTQCD